MTPQLPDLPVGLDRPVGAGIGSSARPAAGAAGRSPIEAASHSRYRPDVRGTWVWATGNPAAGPARRPRPTGRCWDRQLGTSGGRCGRPIAHRSGESLTVPARARSRGGAPPSPARVLLLKGRRTRWYSWLLQCISWQSTATLHRKPNARNRCQSQCQSHARSRSPSMIRSQCLR